MVEKTKHTDLLVGIKAKLSLMDAIRDLADESENDIDKFELCPYNKDDWLAGIRVSSLLTKADLEKVKKKILIKLFSHDSFQRVRRDEIKIYAVQKTTRVFQDSKDTMDNNVNIQDEKDESDNAEMIFCPICGAKVKRYNANFDPWGQIKNCYLCSKI